MDRAHIDDLAANVIVTHPADSDLRCISRGGKVKTDLVIPVFKRHISKFASRDFQSSSGIVDQNVDSSELGDKIRRHLLSLIRFRDITVENLRLTARCTDLFRHGFGSRGIFAEGDPDLAMVFGESQCRSRSDPV